MYKARLKTRKRGNTLQYPLFSSCANYGCNPLANKQANKFFLRVSINPKNNYLYQANLLALFECFLVGTLYSINSESLLSTLRHGKKTRRVLILELARL